MNIAVIFAGGIGKRMNSNGIPKQFLKLNDKEIIIYTLEIFENSKEIDAIVVSCLEEKIMELQKLVKKYNLKKVIKIVKGGKTGQESIYNGIIAAKEISKNENSILLIHDGVRPLINQKVIIDSISCVEKNKSAILVAPAIETIIKSEENKIENIYERSTCFMARAPQSFYLSDILEAHEKARVEKKEFIDSASLMRYYGHKLYIVEGPSENIKITTPIDFYMFKAIKELQKNMEIIGI